MPASEWRRIHGFRENHYQVLKFGLTRERDKLYSRINKRVEKMLNEGWLEEVKGILAMGYEETLRPFSSIGYREILLYIKSLISYEDMVKDIKKKTRHYAKRQMTWFAREKDILWYQFPEDVEKIRIKALEFLRSES